MKQPMPARPCELYAFIQRVSGKVDKFSEGRLDQGQLPHLFISMIQPFTQNYILIRVKTKSRPFIESHTNDITDL